LLLAKLVAKACETAIAAMTRRAKPMRAASGGLCDLIEILVYIATVREASRMPDETARAVG
jgi:hypothetical protein